MTLDNLQPFDMSTVAPFWPENATQTKDAAVELPDSLRILRQSEKHRTAHLLHVANAAKHLETLPEPGETLHALMSGNYHAWDLVPAVLRIASPATIVRLDVATLGFNNRNVAELAALMDAKQIGQVWFLCSCYFRDSSTAEFDFLQEHIAKARGGHVAAARTHAKLQLMELSDGRHYVIESSANLRSCHNVEQFAMFESKEVLLFYRQWIEEFVTHATRPKT